MTTAASDLALRRPAGADDPLRIVLVYEDFEMAIHGKHAHDIFAREVAGGDGHTDLAMWRFNLLQLPEMAALATHHAARADVVIVAPRNLNQLPPAVKEWLERWPPDRSAEGGALVILFHPESPTTSDACGEALLLWRAAERARMDFCCAATDRQQPGRATGSKRELHSGRPLAVAMA